MQKLHRPIALLPVCLPNLFLLEGSVCNVAEATLIGTWAKNFVGTIHNYISKTRICIIDKNKFLHHLAAHS